MSVTIAGAFGLLPFMALWRPETSEVDLPPKSSDLNGFSNLLGKVTESPITAWIILVGSASCLTQAALSGSSAWAEFSDLFTQSKLVHITTLDFITLTALAPFWVDNDASRRGFVSQPLLTFCTFAPVIGPAVYLVARPKSSSSMGK